MSKSPKKCPICGDGIKWIKIDQSNKGFSVGKAAICGIIFGKIGILAGAFGKRTSLYYCKNCGFSHEYNGK